MLAFAYHGSPHGGGGSTNPLEEDQIFSGIERIRVSPEVAAAAKTAAVRRMVHTPGPIETPATVEEVPRNP